MAGRISKVRSREGSDFDCYLAMPKSADKVPAVVLASAIHGVDEDICGLADEFAGRGYIAAAPDLFWRSLPGPLPREDSRAAERSQPRLEKLRAGEADLADTLAHLRSLPQSNGRAAVMGFCYGGPYAILGPKRLGYDAGIACHGTQMLDFLRELNGVAAPVCIIWGDRDYVAPADVLTAYRDVAARMPNVELHIIPGVLHSYMMRRNVAGFDSEARTFSMTRALAILDLLRQTNASAAM
ncbi:MAG TPA: dienelactone hydrolase family protein [Aestuariivirgaceae bacterium]|nr:dienelactone hydrolase family protein [Aestuariivirgaceae bacterium]